VERQNNGDPCVVVVYEGRKKHQLYLAPNRSECVLGRRKSNLRLIGAGTPCIVGIR